MEFGSQEDHMGKGKLPFSYSSSSSPSSSSSQQKTHPVPSAHIYDNQQMSSWLRNMYVPEQEDASTLNESGTAAKIELLDVDDEEDGGGGGDVAVVDKEHMFDKVVTPSDVGKLNRLVIPKQHAEKYFPLDSSSNEKGLLLNFEDRTGKAWRFRYSYWNSSQSYVMTKGWSRFVKEKKLVSGDIVSFQRGVGESRKDHLYIDWRRRPDAADHQNSLNRHHQHLSSTPWSPLLMRPPGIPLMPRDHRLHLCNTSRNYGYYYNSRGGSCHGYSYSSSSNVGANPRSSSGTIVYMRSPQQVGMEVGMVQWQQGAGGGVVEPMIYESVPVVQGKAAAKRLRLFGVNMDCPMADSISKECDKFSSSTAAALQSPESHHHSLQLRLYNGMPLEPSMPSTQFLRKGKSSSMSLDLDI